MCTKPAHILIHLYTAFCGLHPWHCFILYEHQTILQKRGQRAHTHTSTALVPYIASLDHYVHAKLPVLYPCAPSSLSWTRKPETCEPAAGILNLGLFGRLVCGSEVDSGILRNTSSSSHLCSTCVLRHVHKQLDTAHSKNYSQEMIEACRSRLTCSATQKLGNPEVSTNTIQPTSPAGMS